MTGPLWSFDKLAWFARAEDPEVRYWATERLVRGFPDRAPSAVALLVLDEHDTTPELVAENLGDHGSAEHIPILLRAYRQMRGAVPGKAFEALSRIGYPDLLRLARAAIDRTDLSETSLALVIEATASVGTPAAHALVREMVDRRVELLADARAFRAALESSPSSELTALLASFARALQWRGLGRMGDLLRVLTDHVEADDCGWCMRTGPDGRIDFRKTLKAVESGYDCELEGPAPALQPDSIRELALAFRSRDLSAALACVTATLLSNAASLPSDPEDSLPDRIAAIVMALSSPQFRAEAERLGPVFLQGIASVLFSCLLKLARYRNCALEVQRAGDDTEALLALAGEETAFLLELLPPALARSVEPPAVRDEHEGAARRESVLRWCRRMLDARGPFFPKAIALETIGELREEDHVPDVLDYLSDENSYVYGAAEKAVRKLGGALAGPLRARLEARALDHEAMHSLLTVLVEQGDRWSLAILLDHLEDFAETVGVGETAEWAALLGARELLEPLHRLLPRDIARVGQALLLLGAIHNVPIPEEPQIRGAIEDYWRRHPAGEEAGGDDEGSGSYLM